MNARIFLYADQSTLEMLDGAEEKLLLIGSDFGYGNFGDILQLKNTAAWHRGLGRYRRVAVMAADAIGDAAFPAFVRQAYGVDGVIFVTEAPLDLATAGPLLLPVAAISRVGAIHLYGGGFLNDRWGEYVLNVAEYFLDQTRPEVYVISGQQLTTPFETRVAQHIARYRPALVGVRDLLSQRWLSGAGVNAGFSFDDATEALRQMIAGFPLRRGPGLLAHLNVSYYTSNDDDARQLRGELIQLADRELATGGVTLLQAFATRQGEVVDSRESVKELERFFPFADYRTIELAALAYGSLNASAAPIVGEIGYSCSYHVALWLQLAGIPCWLRGSNLFYRQKCEALKVPKDFSAFLRDPQATDHRDSLDRRQQWLAQLAEVFQSAPKALGTAHFERGDLPPAQAWRYKRNRADEWRQDNERLYAENHRLGQSVDERTALAEALRRGAESAEGALQACREEAAWLREQADQWNARFADLTRQVETQSGELLARQTRLMQAEQGLTGARNENELLRKQNQALVERVTELGAFGHDQQIRAELAEEKIRATELAGESWRAQGLDLQQRVDSADRELADRQQRIEELTGLTEVLNARITELGADCHDQRRRAELAETNAAASRQEADALFKRLTGVLESRSWKLTRPLRGIRRMLVRPLRVVKRILLGAIRARRLGH